MLNVVPPLLAALTTAAILGVAGLRVMDGALTVGALVAFQSLMQRFSAPIEGLVQFGGNLQTVKGDLARIADVMNYRTQRTSAGDGKRVSVSVDLCIRRII